MRLRRFTVDDLALVVGLNTDPEVMRHLGAPQSIEHIRDVELPAMITPRAAGLGYWAAFDGTTFVGWGCANPVDADLREVEIGYRIVQAHWGRGYATELAQDMIRRAFAAGAGRVIATTMAVNAGSRRVLEKCGLRHVGTWHGEWDDPLPGAEHGDVDYALERPASAARSSNS